MCSVLNVHMISQQFSDVVVLEEKLTTYIQCTLIFCTTFLLDHCMGYPIHGIFYKLFLVMKMIEMWILLTSFQYGHMTFSTLHQHSMIYIFTNWLFKTRFEEADSSQKICDAGPKLDHHKNILSNLGWVPSYRNPGSAPAIWCKHSHSSFVVKFIAVICVTLSIKCTLEAIVLLRVCVYMFYLQTIPSANFSHWYYSIMTFSTDYVYRISLNYMVVYQQSHGC